MRPTKVLSSRRSWWILCVLSATVLGTLFSAIPLWAQGTPPLDAATSPDWLTEFINRHGLGLGLVAVFLGGLALNFPKPLLGWAVTGLLLGAGVYLGWCERTPRRGRWFVWVRRCVGSTLVLAAAAWWWPWSPSGAPSVSWVPYSEAAFTQAKREGRPILIDIYADWCLPCVEMDHVTFRHPSVVQELASVATLRLDATSEISPEGEALLERFNVYGAPTLLFFDRAGAERTTLRLNGFAKPDEFLRRLRQILTSEHGAFSSYDDGT